MKYVILDTETTGVSKADQVIQLAMVGISNQREHLLSHKVEKPLWEQHKEDCFKPTKAIQGLVCEMYNPTVPINKHALAVHGISKLKLTRKPSTDTFKSPIPEVLIAHNSPFDIRMLKQTDPTVDLSSTKVICTMRLAKAIEKVGGNKFGFDNYQLKSMFGFFYPDLAKLYETQLHDALGDCEMTLLVMIKLWESFPMITTLEGLHQFFFEK